MSNTDMPGGIISRLPDQRFFIDMLLETRDFMAYDPEIKKIFVMLAISLSLGAVMLLICISFVLHDRAIARKYDFRREAANRPDLEYAFSENAELRIYDDKCAIYVNGASVSAMISNILSVTCNMRARDPVISIIYKDDDNNIKIEDIHCGFVADDKYKTLRSVMLQYLGG